MLFNIMIIIGSYMCHGVSVWCGGACAGIARFYICYDTILTLHGCTGTASFCTGTYSYLCTYTRLRPLLLLRFGIGKRLPFVPYLLTYVILIDGLFPYYFVSLYLLLYCLLDSLYMIF